MTIETGPAHGATRPSAASDSRHAKAKPHGGADPGSDAMGGFTSILASLDASGVDAPTPAADGALSGNPALDTASVAGTGGGLAAANQLGVEGSLGIGGNADSAGTPNTTAALQADIGQLLRGKPADGTAATLPTRASVPVATDGRLDASEALARSPQSSALSALVGEGENSLLRAEAGTSAVNGAKLPHSAWTQASGVDLNALAGEQGLNTSGNMAKSHKDAVARLASVNAALAAPTDSTVQPDAHAALTAAKVVDTPLNPITTALAMANTATPIRRDEQTRERSVFRPTVTENGPVTQSYLPSAANVSASNAPDAQMPVDLYVAEKVAYWVSNDVHNAEMKLDGIGADPVEVSIRMQGNEAHIAFRTDELQARAALENAGVHLKDLLQREGLVLSGVSVGTSDTGGSGEQERRSRQGGRQSVVATVQPVQADRSTASSRIAGGSLDLFV